LAADKIKTKPDIPLGIMIEIPSAALIANHLAKEADFFSLGTNDLVQYTLAVDRTNEMLGHLYQTYHPAVLQLIEKTINSGHRYKRKVAICGEMGADPYGIILLVGLGIDELSVNFQSTGLVKSIVRQIDFRRAKLIAKACCKKAPPKKLKIYLTRKLKNIGRSWFRLLNLLRG
jgi:phosphotransferase system enzyme I (PtsI)